MHIETIQDNCIGAGNCVALAAKYFDIDDDGLVVALHDDVAIEDEDIARRAESGCPAAAIVLHT